jgi:translocation and assembly module TamB
VQLRAPEGVRSTVDADLAVRGNVRGATVSGAVTVRNAVWSRRLAAPESLLDLFTRRRPADSTGAGGESAAPSVPLRYDIQVLVPSTFRVDNNLARLVANADLTLRGTYERPVLFGHADVERGDLLYRGRRFRVTKGSLDFTNPARIEPFFDVEAQTDVRVTGQTYRVTVAATGTTEKLVPTLTSDPPLRAADILALLFSDVNTTQDTELKSLQNPTQVQTGVLTSTAAQALASPISAGVGKVVEQTFGVDSFQLTPALTDPYGRTTTRLNPTARLTIGKRISDRVYLTFSRSLASPINDQIILLEIDSTDRLSWILSRNEDSQTFALEFRVRHTF